jgi:hypothetical protein
MAIGTVTIAVTPADKRHAIGQQVQSAASFKNSAGTATDPTTVTCMVREPDGTETSYVNGTDVECVKDSTGEYHLIVALNAAGSWKVRWKGVAVVDAAAEHEILADPSTFVTP